MHSLSLPRQYNETYWVQEPVYETHYIRNSPKALQFSIHGELYTYEEGAVSPELAAVQKLELDFPHSL
jgi:hypothetical protein